MIERMRLISGLFIAVTVIPMSFVYAATDADDSSEVSTTQDNTSVDGATDSQSEKLYVAGMIGTSTLNEDRGTGVGYGVEGAWFLQPNFGLGAYYREGSHEKSLTSKYYGAEALYRFDPWFKPLTVGALVGFGKFNAGTFQGDSHFSYGAKAQLDFRLMENHPVTFGVEASLTQFQVANTVTGEEIRYLNFIPAATVRLWF